MLTIFAKFIFRIGGWTYEPKSDAWEAKQVVVGFPHTTNMDGVRTLALFKIYGIKVHALVKKDLFFWPLSWFLTRLGCLPVDRSRKSNLVQDMKKLFDSHKEFTLLIAPEGTRHKLSCSNAKPIKTGFWHIAKAAGVPIILMLSDAAAKRGRMVAKLFPSDSIRDDLIRIRDLYAPYGIKLDIGEA
ncbi:acyltransferase [Hahella sp. CCB-MM4]|uniref:1-acyl-sn-glycerol-3-phosphate acyltransferase n=1 Tax=Hahella sp. (strain CCB-MM4) TaxID=1926491 RepID=UPI000B9BE8B1|nr:1-acyl-sn-glycerol-3-phosphate acyltransferase [Hahella sp. CCB-MM4]OZG71883.1 acyltransferase [Hahella sp. CCB-MM4]